MRYWRVLLVAGRSLLLQVAHPVVAAGVAQHSDYMTDPWGRLDRTINVYLGVIFGGVDGAVDAGASLREMHKRVKGVDANGRSYHALEPEPFHWVHATLVDGIAVMLERFERPLSGAELEELYAEMREVGRLYGVRDRDMPPDWAAFRTYFDEFVRTKLEDNEVVRNVLGSLARPVRPPWLPLPEGAWRVGSRPAVRVSSLATVGLLPPTLRERWGLRWTRANELELQAYAGVIRRAVPLLPARLKLTQPAYAARRRRDVHQ
ncbi:MAG TPA: oxygenase MpaB family protein [Solirubrobacteraceae bacterium]|nr:oxygenase MpaB family protein [Solirubrobacteraceae bacterium]